MVAIICALSAKLSLSMLALTPVYYKTPPPPPPVYYNLCVNSYGFFSESNHDRVIQVEVSMDILYWAVFTTISSYVFYSVFYCTVH